MLDPLSGEVREEMKRIYRHVDAALENLRLNYSTAPKRALADLKLFNQELLQALLHDTCQRLIAI